MRHALPRRRARITLLPSALSAGARESPTPIALLSGPWCTAAALDGRLRLSAALAAHGFSVCLADLPGYGRAQGLPRDWGVDEVVEDLHGALTGALRHPTPCVIAHSASAVLMQHYLESFPLAALVMLAPLPPSGLGASLQRWLGGSERAAPLDVGSVAAALRRVAGTPQAARMELLAGARTPEEALEACMADAEEVCLVDGGAAEESSLCGVDAAAQLLLGLAESRVSLEPQPVPMCIVAPGSEAMLTESEASATAELHGLCVEDGSVLPAGALGHACMYGEEADVAGVRDGVVRWVAERF